MENVIEYNSICLYNKETAKTEDNKPTFADLGKINLFYELFGRC